MAARTFWAAAVVAHPALTTVALVALLAVVVVAAPLAVPSKAERVAAVRSASLTRQAVART
jgi:hypothetical protein